MVVVSPGPPKAWGPGPAWGRRPGTVQVQLFVASVAPSISQLSVNLDPSFFLPQPLRRTPRGSLTLTTLQPLTKQFKNTYVPLEMVL